MEDEGAVVNGLPPTGREVFSSSSSSSPPSSSEEEGGTKAMNGIRLFYFTTWHRPLLHFAQLEGPSSSLCWKDVQFRVGRGGGRRKKRELKGIGDAMK